MSDESKATTITTAIKKERPLADVLWGQLNMLESWNKKNVEAEPEQVRKNIETMVDVAYALME